MLRTTACPSTSAPRCPRPGRSHRTHRPGRSISAPARSLSTDGTRRLFIPVTNLLERSLGEVKRRTKVIGRFPGETSCLTLVWAVLDLYISHATNGIKFTALERQRLRRMRYQDAEEAPRR